MSPKIWGIDFDSTINDMNKHICKTLNIKHNCDITEEEVTHWNYWNDHPLADVVWSNSIYHNEEWTLSIPPRNGALWTITQLLERGDRIVVITDRFATEYGVVREWLDRHGLQSVLLSITDKKLSKAEIAENIGITAVIDDSPHWIDMYAQSDSLKDIYVMHYEYNRDVPDDDRIKRINGWGDLGREEFSELYETRIA